MTAAAILLLVVVVAYRIIVGFVGTGETAWLYNFSPLAAVALCGAAFLPRKIALILPLAILFLSDLALNAYHGRGFLDWEILPRYAALLLVAGMGLALRDRRSAPALLGASVAGSVLFYALTNAASFISEPGYVKSVGGFVQALWTGLPGFPPTYLFFRNTVISDLFFTALFLGCFAWSARRQAVQAPVAARPTAA